MTTITFASICANRISLNESTSSSLRALKKCLCKKDSSKISSLGFHLEVFVATHLLKYFSAILKNLKQLCLSLHLPITMSSSIFKAANKVVVPCELFSQVDYEQMIPKTHLLRRVDRVLDLHFCVNSPLHFTQTKRVGHPLLQKFSSRSSLQHRFDPVALRRSGYNLAYRWFCKFSLKDSVPVIPRSRAFVIVWGKKPIERFS